jgi:hypothetical protein
MKSFIVACVAAIVIAVIGGVVLASIQEPVDKQRRAPRRVRPSADKRRVGEKADARAGLDCRHVFRKFQ